MQRVASEPAATVVHALRLAFMLVDFTKAFDMVQRQLLWRRACTLGLGGKLLDAIRYMYEKPRLMPEYKAASQHELYCMMQYISVGC